MPVVALLRRLPLPPAKLALSTLSSHLASISHGLPLRHEFTLVLLGIRHANHLRRRQVLLGFPSPCFAVASSPVAQQSSSSSSSSSSSRDYPPDQPTFQFSSSWPSIDLAITPGAYPAIPNILPAAYCRSPPSLPSGLPLQSPSNLRLPQWHRSPLDVLHEPEVPVSLSPKPHLPPRAFRAAGKEIRGLCTRPHPRNPLRPLHSPPSL